MRHIACTADCLKTHAMRIELDIGRAIVHDKPTSCSIYRFGFVLRLCIRTHLPTLARFNVQRPVGRTEYCPAVMHRRALVSYETSLLFQSVVVISAHVKSTVIGC